MKELIEKKIEEIVNYIVSKEASEVTLDEYTILTNELKGIENKEYQANNEKRMAGLLASTFSCNPFYGQKLNENY